MFTQATLLENVRNYFSIIIGCILLTDGCGWIPAKKYQAQYIEPFDVKNTIARNHRREEVFPDWPQDHWWEEFKSSELNELIDIALADNPGLRAVAERLQVTNAAVRVESARLLPFLEAEAVFKSERLVEATDVVGVNPLPGGEIEFDPNIGADIRSNLGGGFETEFNPPDGEQETITLGEINPIGLRYQLDFWGENRTRVEEALGQAMAMEAELAHMRLTLTTAIARAYFQGLATYQQLNLLHDMIGLRQDLLDLAKIRVQLGIDDFRSVVEAAANLEEIYKQEAETKDLLAFYQYLIAKLIGHGSDAGENLFIDSTVTTPQGIPLPDTIPSGLLTHRPDLAAAMFRAQAAAKTVQVAKIQFLPTIDLRSFTDINATTLVEDTGSLPRTLFSRPSLSYGGGVGLRLPWFQGGRLRAVLEAQRAEYNNAVETYNDTLLNALKEIATSLNTWHQTRKILESQHRLLVSIKENWYLSQVNLQTGLDDRRNSLEHQYAVLDQKFDLRGIEADELTAMISLIEALGGGYPYYIDTQEISTKIEQKNRMQRSAQLIN
ncbi:efflux transporter outer membrane subunit [Candidatus Nitrosacidococcus tergens]|uniref:Putative outer membrane chanel lipoprotein n=1 Tax=Candidatus Nitrosacidococcus tergens TaxID=553981 RepID=A0A7G1QAL9_9GAMM|nr:efflux transporter outer membrane subunit [Candidatus Nitrosacidococcus tergens]CAB1276434.1 putative outer membrane chanel lipoprotein [Candidatus Nitrosacidococcus tergens]